MVNEVVKPCNSLALTVSFFAFDVVWVFETLQHAACMSLWEVG